LANKLKTISQTARFKYVGVHTHSFTHFRARFSFGKIRKGQQP